MLLRDKLTHPVFSLIADVARELDLPVYVVGGWVRDLILGRDSKDIDIVVQGSGIALATQIADKLGTQGKISIFKKFGTANIRIGEYEVEFVGARKESYRLDSRKPIVEEGSLMDDISRRDFTINTMAISLNSGDFGALLDPFGGLEDLHLKRLKTPLAPDITFSDDPLRMMRGLRFEAQLGFKLDDEVFDAIKRNAQRLSIVSVERIMDEFQKMMAVAQPGQGLMRLHTSGLLQFFFPELDALKGVDALNGVAHKDNLLHTIQVLDNLAAQSDNLWLRWATLLHDIAKPLTKMYQPDTGWTFHGHEYLGGKLVPKIFARLKLPLNEKMKYVQKLVMLHMRPIALSSEEVTDSAVRRLLFDAGDDIDDLMLLCRADITSGNKMKVRRILQNFEIVTEKLRIIEAKDRIKNWQPPVTGDDIMNTFGLKPGREVGIIKNCIREAILDGKIPNKREEALELMLDEGKKIGLKPVVFLK